MPGAVLTIRRGLPEASYSEASKVMRYAIVCNCLRPYGERGLTVLLLAVLGASACSSATNPWAFTTAAKQEQSFDVQVALGRAYFDAGELELAHEHAKLAYAANPESEEAATLLGYVYLSLAGITPFVLAEKMITDKKGSSPPAADAASSPAASEGGTSSALGGLDEVVGLSPSEFKELGTLNVYDPSLPVIEPVCAGKARLDVKKLAYVNDAIAVICPFVDPEVLLADDQRHACRTLKTKRSKRAQAHFLWAFAHLVEAVAFHEVINYATVDPARSNLEMRADRVEALGNNIGDDITQIDVFVNAMNDFAATVERVLQTSGNCSSEHPQTQLVALVNDLKSVSQGFGRMEGVPKAMTASIDKAIGRIDAIQERSAGVAQSEAQAGAIKSDMTQKMAKTLSDVISSVDPEKYSPEQIDKVCSSYGQISGNQEADANRPEICPPL